MKNLIKIIAILTALSTMTACGASGLVDDLAKGVNDALERLKALRLETATRQIRTEELDEFRKNLPNNLSPQEREDMVAEEAKRLASLTGTEKADFDARVQTRVTYLAEVAELTEVQRAANELKCRVETTGDGCDVVLVTFCGENPFHAFCFDARGYFTKGEYDIRREEICEVDSIKNDCTTTIVRVCNANPFATLCAKESDYNLTRKNICEDETTSARCKPTVDRICMVNIYDDVCNGTTYAESRSASISRTEYEMRNCVNLIGDGECIQLLTFICTENPLDTFCDEQIQYRPERRTLCLAETADPGDCAKTIEQVCSADSLDSLCEEEQAYFSLQASACNGESAISNPACATTLTRVCGNLAGTSPTGDPFSTTCRNAAFQPARDAIIFGCTTQTDGRLCQAVRDDTCANTPFDLVCKGAVAYLPAQIRACIGQPATGNCADASFFTDPVILSCLADPFDVSCTMSGSTFAPYVSVAQDATCLADNTRATNCANPTAVFATLPTTLRGVRKNPDAPHAAGTNDYINGFITIDRTDLDNGNLMAVHNVEAVSAEDASDGVAVDAIDGNFVFASDDAGQHTTLGLFVGAGAAIADNPETTDINEANPVIPAAAVTLRRDSGATDNSDSDDGVAYFGTHDSTGNSNGLAYGGILPTTNLGAPLLPQAAVAGNNATAIWGGHVSYRQNPNAQNRVTKFYVDFTAGTIGFANTAETDGTGTVDVPIGSSATNLRLSGKFGASHTGLDGNPLAPGQLGGTVGYYFGIHSAETADSVPNVGDFNVHGLIGQEGAVAVFLNATAANTLVGGFTASNPDHPNND